MDTMYLSIHKEVFKLSS